jgi:glycosyltransferase involved in cell wall biosynthesis
MNETKLLTIIIPTYNRAERLRNLLKELTPIAVINSNFHIMISDDSSTDHTTHVASEFGTQFKSLSYRKNISRLGFKGNLNSAISVCETSLYMLLWDDETPLPYGIMDILNFIKDHQNFSFYSPKYYLNGRLYRGSEEIERISLINHRNYINHAPGLIFKTSLSIDCAKNYAEFFFHPDNWYPQAMIAAYSILTQGDACNVPIQVCTEIGPENSGLGDYSSLSGRWSEWKLFLKFYEKISEQYPNNAEVMKLINMHKASLVGKLAFGALTESPDYYRSFLESLRLSVVKSS